MLTNSRTFRLLLLGFTSILFVLASLTQFGAVNEHRRFLIHSRSRKLHVRRFSDGEDMNINRSELTPTMLTLDTHSPRQDDVVKAEIYTPVGETRWVQNTNSCLWTQEPRLLVFITSAIANYLQRSVIRNTWMLDAAKHNCAAVFLMGSSENPATQRLVAAEQKMYNDIIQHPFLDSYRNLTLTSIAMLEWVTGFCPGARAILKTDDDTFINVPKLLSLLPSPDSIDHVAIGYVHEDVQLERHPSDKWYVPEALWPSPTWPPYCGGFAYVLCGPAIAQMLFAECFSTPMVPVEDVYVTGMLAKKAGVGLHSRQGEFNYNIQELPNDLEKYAAIHRMPPGRVPSFWRDLKQEPRGINALIHKSLRFARRVVGMFN